MTVAIIPARSGSQRLVDKNIRELNGHPLIFYSLDCAMSVDEVERCIFSTDSEAYIELVQARYGDKVNCVLRPNHYGGNEVKVIDEIIRLIEAGNVREDWVSVLLPTLPLRTPKDLSEGLRFAKRSNVSVFSSHKYEFPPQFAFEIDHEGKWLSRFDDNPMITGQTRSQDIGSLYRPNGAFFISSKDRLLKTRSFYTDAKPFVIESAQCIDIDTIEQFDYAEFLLGKQRNA